MSFILNGRFLHYPIGGVYRYAYEIYSRLEDDFKVRTPSNNGRGILGYVWEQQVLGRYIPPHSLLWSPTNSGPLNVKNQVVTIHDISVLEHPAWYRKSFSAWYRYMLPKLVFGVKKVLTDSSFSKERILHFFGISPEKVDVIPNGVGWPFIAETAVDVEPSIRLPERFILAVGAIQPRKNYSTLVLAWNEIRIRYPDYHLVIIGNKDRVFTKYDFPTLVNNMTIMNNVDDQTLAAIYRKASVLIDPSFYEGFGLPALEAMACGTPIIAANNSALPEVVGEAGLYFNPYKADELIDQMDTFLKNESLQNKLRKNTFNQAAKFSWDTTSHKVLQVLKDVVGEL